MITNKIFTIIASVACLLACFYLWTVAITVAFNLHYLSSVLLVGSVKEYLITGLWAKFYISAFAFIFPVFLLVALAGLKAWILPRDVSQYEAWQLELNKADSNGWNLFFNLSGNFK